MTAHLCLACRHAKWERKKGQLTGIGFCEAPDPELPKLPAVKWWNVSRLGGIRGGDIYRDTKHPVMRCAFYEKVAP